jgi:hypothetical protein
MQVIDCRLLATSNRSASDNSRRRGVSLIELIVVIGMLSSIFSLTGVTFHLLFRTGKGVAQSFVTERSLSRLAVQFRDDVHQAETGVITGGSDGTRIELSLGDASGVRVRYVVTSEGLARLLVEQGNIVARDDFRLPECRISLSVGQEPDAALRTLTIERHGASLTQQQSTHRPYRELAIEAYLNRQPRSVNGPATTATETGSRPVDNSVEVQK